jgi:hypothetical protein
MPRTGEIGAFDPNRKWQGTPGMPYVRVSQRILAS